MHAIWANWAPPAERSRLATISYAGPHIGTVLSFPLSALLVEYGFAGGWPSVFYVFGEFLEVSGRRRFWMHFGKIQTLFSPSGMVGILWFGLWMVVGYSSPSTHPRISNEEREYIESSIAAEGKAEKV